MCRISILQLGRNPGQLIDRSMIKAHLAARQDDVQVALRELMLAVATAVDYDAQLAVQRRQQEKLQPQPQQSDPQQRQDPGGGGEPPSQQNSDAPAPAPASAAAAAAAPAEPHPQYHLALRQAHQCLVRFEQACDQLALGLHACVDRLDAKRALDLLQPPPPAAAEGSPAAGPGNPAENLGALLSSIEQVVQVYSALQGLDPAQQLKPAQPQPESSAGGLKGLMDSLGSLCEI